MTDTAVATIPTGAALAEQVVIKGDLKALSEEDRMRYYTAVCESLGLNPLTRPFEYLALNGKLTLYATRAAADQLRALRGITITSLDPRQIGDLYVVVATGRDRSGREDSSTGAVAVKGLSGESLANAMMKAETKAKRRLTLSLAGLGMTDETEVDSIPGAERVESLAPLSLAERAAAKAAELSPAVKEAPAEPSAEADVADGGTGPASAPLQELFDGDGLVRLRLSKQEFVDRLDAAGIDQQHAVTVRLVMFPEQGHELDDAERGALWAQLDRERLAAV